MHSPRACVFLLSCLAAAGEAQARVYMTQEQALARVFPAPQTIERRTLFLDEEQSGRAAALAGVPIEARVVPYYVGTREGGITGYAYFDSHLVRTLPETVLIALDAAGRVTRVEIVSFEEPEDYALSEQWLRQFPGLGQRDGPDMGKRIRSMTGATLSARAVTQAVRRVLAIHGLFAAPPPPGAPRP